MSAYEVYIRNAGAFSYMELETFIKFAKTSPACCVRACMQCQWQQSSLITQPWADSLQSCDHVAVAINRPLNRWPWLRSVLRRSGLLEISKSVQILSLPGRYSEWTRLKSLVKGLDQSPPYFTGVKSLPYVTATINSCSINILPSAHSWT